MKKFTIFFLVSRNDPTGSKMDRCWNSSDFHRFWLIFSAFESHNDGKCHAVIIISRFHSRNNFWSEIGFSPILNTSNWFLARSKAVITAWSLLSMVLFFILIIFVNGFTREITFKRNAISIANELAFDWLLQPLRLLPVDFLCVRELSVLTGDRFHAQHFD